MPIDKYLPFFNGKSFKSQENIDTFLQLYDATTIYAQIGFGGQKNGERSRYQHLLSLIWKVRPD